MVLHLFETLLDEAVALTEIGCSLVDEQFLALLKLSLIHLMISQRGKSIPTELLFCGQITNRDVS